MMPFASLALIYLLAFGIPNTKGIRVRDLNGNWVHPNWGKRASPGDLLHLPLQNNDDKSYSVRHFSQE
jgi:hypothetical protein